MTPAPEAQGPADTTGTPDTAGTADTADTADTAGTAGTAHTTARRSGTHPTRVGYLVVGLVFLSIAGLWALGDRGLVDLGEARWLLPVALVVAGAVGLLAALKGSGGPRRPRNQPSDRER